MKAQVITFNTGRQYSDHGQRIACTRLPDGRVMFADVDRNIDGITLAPAGAYADSCLHDFVMREYDHGRYEWGTPAGALELEALMAHLVICALTL